MIKFLRFTQVAPLFVYVNLIAVVGAFAQTGQISGTVVDEANTPLPGVNVVIKGTTDGTTTDSDGTFKLSVPGNATLVFSFIGFQTQELQADGRSVVNIVMTADVQSLQEVVVVGYGESSKAKITGAVATVESKVFEQRNSLPNPMAALQGQIPGVIVTRSAGAPGREGWDFQIRGASSVNSAQPLVIVDGIPLVSTNALNTLNPNDIENMTVLKDASAAAIYGSRAAGGVVLITTKKAKSGKPTIQYDGSASRKIVGLKPELLTANQWGPALKTAIENNNVLTSDPNWLWYRYAQLYIDRPESGYVDLTKEPNTIGFGDVKDFTFFDTDWQDVLWGNATTTQHNLSLSAKTDKMGYRLSLGLLDEGSTLQW
jgi:TonB-linked SusC/RagA family outer membrane protein